MPVKSAFNRTYVASQGVLCEGDCRVDVDLSQSLSPGKPEHSSTMVGLLVLFSSLVGKFTVSMHSRSLNVSMKILLIGLVYVAFDVIILPF